MKEAERLAGVLDGWSGFIGSGYECPAAGQPMVEAATLLRAQSARIAALEEVLRAIEDMETNWALGIDGGMENARRAARKALGKGSE